MSAEGWTALATIVIAVATVVYMAVSIFQGRMILKGFRLSAFQTLKEMVTPERPGMKGLTNFMFYRLYREVFPRDYKKFQKAMTSAIPDPDQLMKLLSDLQKVLQGFPKALANVQDPFLGMCADEPELMDEITESVMQAREQHPLRQGGG
jgi:hypothetical protein